MSTEKSERILAALSRAKASRPPNTPPSIEPVEVAEVPQTSLAELSEEENEPVTPEAESDSAEEPLEDSAEAEGPAFEETEEVETVLPFVAASDQQRVAPSISRTSSPAKREEPPAPISTAARAIKREEPVASTPVASSNDTPRNIKLEPDFLAPVSVAKKFPIKLVVTGGAVVLIGLSLFLLRDHLWTSKPSGGGADASLQMQVESQGSGIINIRWNPESSIVTEAREGRLVILEHDQQPRTVPLGAEQLKIGHLFYQSPVESVEFRLEIVGPSGAVNKASVLALASAKAAEPAAGPPIAPTAPKAGAEQAASTRTTPAATAAKPEAKIEAKAETKPEPAPVKKPVEVAPTRPLVTRSFTPPAIQKKTGETGAGALMVEPPPSVPSGPAALSAVSLPETAARIAAPPAPAPPAPQPLKSGGYLQAPKLIKRVTPDYPAAARAANIQGIVKFTATIAKDGTLHNVQAVGGPSLLIPAATEAVKKWVYQPMLLDGQPVEVVTQIEVNFALHQ